MLTTVDDMVSIPVPKRHLTRVYAFIGSLDEQLAAPGDMEAVAEEDAATGWTPELIERQFRESPAFMKRFQKHLAEHPGQEFSTRDMAEALDAEFGWNTVAGALGAYGRRVQNRYKQSTGPFNSRTDYEERPQVFHSMSEEVAEIIRDL